MRNSYLNSKYSSHSSYRDIKESEVERFFRENSSKKILEIYLSYIENTILKIKKSLRNYNKKKTLANNNDNTNVNNSSNNKNISSNNDRNDNLNKKNRKRK